MKNSMRVIKKSVIYFALIIAFILLFSLGAFAEDDFEKTLESFPESYQPYLVELHEEHPQWVFLPFETGLDWNESVKAQYGDEALVQNSISADILKSHDTDDYNYEIGSFVYKDGGFVQASELAVEYFLDPRNFLTEEGIFQFEMLSFSEIFTVEAVELILKNSFMYSSKISYLDSQGNLVSTDKTYAQVIYQAGKTYNINPCYLASKILNEVGSDGSYSVWGNHSVYPGIYNFYNIGATDGANAITRGLAWANGGSDGKLTTYSRPWNTPEKSIMGGAQFLAASYIAVGQFTGYLQRFNVNPDGLYNVHTHQYMTNLTGAVSQGYTSYASYAKLGILENQFVFSIPVFENMPESESDDSISFVESRFQYGKVNVNGVNVRTGPSTTYARLQSSTGENILLYENTQVRIIKKHFVDSSYYSRILQYPIWYEIKFEYNGESYTGYILAEYIDISTVTNIGTGIYDVGIFKSQPDTGGSLMTSNPLVCKIVDSDTVEFLSEGKVYLTVYNSCGLVDRIYFNVIEEIGDYQIGNMAVESGETTITVTLPKNENIERYGFYLKDENGKFIKGGDITSNTYTFKNLESNSKYTVYSRYVKGFCYDNGPLKAVEVYTDEKYVPDAPTQLVCSEVTENGYTLSWKSNDADGYRIYRYQPENAKYIIYGDFKESSVEITDLSAGYACAYRIKAYKTVDGKRVYSDYSSLFWTLTLPQSVSAPEGTDVTDTKIDIVWNSCESADLYRLYLYTQGDADVLLYEGEFTSFSFTSALPCTEYSFYVVTVASGRGITRESKASELLTVVTDVSSVSGFVATDITADSYTLSWTEIPNAEFYTVYRYEDGNYVKYVSTTLPYYEFSLLENSTKSFYKVTATYRVDSLMVESDFSQEFSVATLPDKVENISGVAYEDKIKLTWDEVKNADCYNVYYYENGRYVLKKTVTQNSYTLEGLADASRHYVRVRAYIRASLGTQKGLISTYGFYTMAKTVKEMTASSVTDSSMTLSWSESSQGVNRYYIYRYDEQKGGFKCIKTTSKTTLSLTGLESGKTYKFRIIPAIIKNGSIYIRGYTSATFSFSTNLSKVKNLTAEDVETDSFVLKWDNIENATCYRVYRYDSLTKKYILEGSVYDNYISIDSLESGKKYYYKVRAIKKESGSYTYGYYSDLFSVTLKK